MTFFCGLNLFCLFSQNILFDTVNSGLFTSTDSIHAMGGKLFSTCEEYHISNFRCVRIYCQCFLRISAINNNKIDHYADLPAHVSIFYSSDLERVQVIVYFLSPQIVPFLLIHCHSFTLKKKNRKLVLKQKQSSNKTEEVQWIEMLLFLRVLLSVFSDFAKDQTFSWKKQVKSPAYGYVLGCCHILLPDHCFIDMIQ